MAIRQFKPTSPGRRGMSGFTFDEITKSKPEKSLVKTVKKSAGRNAQGRITVRHRGGGSKRRVRIIDDINLYLGEPVVGVLPSPDAGPGLFKKEPITLLQQRLLRHAKA